MFWVSLAYRDTQTQGVVVGGSPWTVLGCSGYPRHTWILRHKGWWCVGLPGLSLDVLGILGLRGYSDTRGGGGWDSLDCPWMFWVSLAYRDTQTQGVVVGGSPWTVLGCSGYLWHTGILRHKGWWWVGVPGLSLDVLGILGIRGYSDSHKGWWWVGVPGLSWMVSLVFRTCLPGHP